MTDITELAQREKFEAWVMTQICISKSTLEGLRTSVGYRNSTLSGSDYNLMWNLWKAAGAELVEALEKAQQRIAELENYAEAEAVGADRAAEDSVYWMKRCKELESRTVTPVTYSENADADYCRKWAWEQVKDEVSTEDWTTGNSVTYFGFFCWGWDMRRQYNEQRPVTVKLPEPYAYLRENDGQIQISIGAERPSDRSGGYATPWFAIYTATGIKVEAE